MWAVEILGLVDELSALQLTNVEAGLSLMEGLILVELVAIGCADDVCVKVFLRYKKLAIADHGVLRET